MANRYWVGGTATWDGTAGLKWALTSGGVGGQLAPTTSDTVFFDANSGANTVTIGTGAVCSTLTMTGFTGTLAFGTNTISAAGTGTVFTGATTYSVSGTPLILVTNATATARTITAGSVTEANSISFNINNGGSTLTVSGSVKDLIFSGSFVGSFPNGALTIYGNLTFKSGMTITAGVNARTFSATSGTQKITSATLNLDFPITFSGTSTYQLQDALSVGTATSRLITFTLGTIDLNGFVLTHFGIFSSANSNTRSIAFNGGNYTNTLNVTNTVVSMAITTGFTYTGTPTFNITGNTTGVTTTVSFTGTETNSLNMNVSSGAGTVALSGTFKNINLTGFTGTLSNTTRTIYGNLIIPSGITALTAGTSVTTFAGTSGTQQITSGTKNLDFPITFSGTVTYQLQDNLSVGTSTSRTITLTTGTLDLNNFTLTNFGIFSSNNSNTRAIAFGSSGVINNTRTGTVTSWDCATITNFTRTGTPYVKFTGTNTTASTITVQHGTTSGGTEDNSMSFYFDSSPTVNLSTTNWIYDLGTLSSWSGTVTNSSTNTYIIYGSFYGSSGANTFGNLTFSSTKSTPRYLPIYSGLLTLITINTSGTGVFNLQANSTIQKLNVLNGSFSTNAYTLDTANFDFDNSNTKSLTFNSQVNIASANSTGIFKGNLTNTTIDMTGSTFVINCNKSTITLDVPNLTYPNISVAINDITSYGNFIFGRGATTQTITNLTIKNNVDPNDILTDFNVKLFAGSTLNVGNISIDGIQSNSSVSINYVVLSSTTAGTQATLNKTSGTVSVSYVKIKDSIATGGATWLAPTTSGNIDNGNNTGWIFGAYSANNSNFLAFF